MSDGNLGFGSRENSVKLWNPNTGSLVYTLIKYSSYVYALATLPNGYLASGSIKIITQLKFWNR